MHTHIDFKIKGKPYKQCITPTFSTFYYAITNALNRFEKLSSTNSLFFCFFIIFRIIRKNEDSIQCNKMKNV